MTCMGSNIPAALIAKGNFALLESELPRIEEEGMAELDPIV